METFLAEYRKKKYRQTSHVETQQQSSTLPTVSRGSGHSAEKSSPEAITAASVDNFSIPELPIGKVLVFNILTTWGDKYYVGLTGIEVFTASGEPAVITEVLTTINEIKRRGELTSICFSYKLWTL